MTSASIVSLQVGQPQQLGPCGPSEPFGEPWAAESECWTSGIFKSPVQGFIALTARGFEGDAQADVVNHGGADKAVCAYSADHYPEWRRALGITPFEYGAFGENLTVAGLNEQTVCIGDAWALGDAVVQVSQPRQPCWKLARRWRRGSLIDDVRRSGRTGWYFRVVTEAPVSCGAGMVLVDRPHPEWTVAAANAVMHNRTGDTRALAALSELAANWRDTLARRLAAT